MIFTSQLCHLWSSVVDPQFPAKYKGLGTAGQPSHGSGTNKCLQQRTLIVLVAGLSLLRRQLDSAACLVTTRTPTAARLLHKRHQTRQEPAQASKAGVPRTDGPLTHAG
jgi:hypothetical protein